MRRIFCEILDGCGREDGLPELTVGSALEASSRDHRATRGRAPASISFYSFASTAAASEAARRPRRRRRRGGVRPRGRPLTPAGRVTAFTGRRPRGVAEAWRD